MRTLILATAMLVTTGAIAAEQTYRLKVDGLACAYCAYGVEKALMKVVGVEHVNVDFEKGLVLVDTAGDVNFSEDELRTIVNDSGFSLRSVERIQNEGQ